MMNQELSDEALQDLYSWIDEIKLSRPKRNISRDFSDGVMAAELVKHFFPKLVDLHNYTPAHSTQQKLSNWSMLNRKVFFRLNFHVPDDTVKKITLSNPGSIEPVLCALRQKIEERKARTVSYCTKDLECFTTENENAMTENGPVTLENSNKKAGPIKKTQKSNPPVVLGENVDPAFRLLLEEKEQALQALQETVEVGYNECMLLGTRCSVDHMHLLQVSMEKILQTKVSRLEHLVHLKDLRIEDLTKHLENLNPSASHSGMSQTDSDWKNKQPENVGTETL
ncbi:sperm flagellar protein 1 isoform X1 [Hemibagrus wyckioides]|uniref:sperm flagellar protein 1 isoform X1 n=1 Tax=Hemibagrus wyckioides TaxID=337641 RepID=UPI00266C521D|nr:sperm flagellar protein 1 isoform X1 [Hemibagrus wyckioides]